jgi:integrase/recombinase XerC
MLNTDSAMTQLQGDFKAHLLRKGMEERTVKLYEAELKQFMAWCSSAKLSLFDMVPEHIYMYREAKLEHGMKLATVNKEISMISTFFKWAKEAGLACSNPAEHIRIPEMRKPPRGLTDEEVEKLIACALMERNDFKRTRNVALLFVMLYAGLRLEEVSDLKLDSLKAHELLVYDRGLPVRTVPLDDRTFSRLNDWLEHRKAMKRPEHTASQSFFVSERSGFMQPRAIQFVIETFSEKIGVHFVCQTLRHTYCYRLAKQGATVHQLKQWAGHKSILTSYQYFEQGGLR